MRVCAVLTIAVAVLLSAGCGDQGDAGTTRDAAGVTGQVRLGPQCPVETGNDPCLDKLAARSSVTVAQRLSGDSSGGLEVVARTTTDAHGMYRIALAPGRYVVTADAGMTCRLLEARVTPDAYSKVDIRCDTGIR